MYNFKIVIESMIGLLGPEPKAVGEALGLIIYTCRDLVADFYMSRDRIVLNTMREPTAQQIADLERVEHDFRIRCGLTSSPTPARCVQVQRSTSLGARDNGDPARASPPSA